MISQLKEEEMKFNCSSRARHKTQRTYEFKSFGELLPILSFHPDPHREETRNFDKISLTFNFSPERLITREHCDRGIDIHPNILWLFPLDNIEGNSPLFSRALGPGNDGPFASDDGRR